MSSQSILVLKIVLGSREPMDNLSKILILYNFPATNQISAKLLYLWLTCSNASLLWESKREKHWFSQSKPIMKLLIINRAPVPICWQSLTINRHKICLSSCLSCYLSCLCSYLSQSWSPIFQKKCFTCFNKSRLEMLKIKS